MAMPAALARYWRGKRGKGKGRSRGGYRARGRSYARRGGNALTKSGGLSMWLCHANTAVIMDPFTTADALIANPTAGQVKTELANTFSRAKSGAADIAVPYIVVGILKLVKRGFRVRWIPGWLL